MRLLRRLVADAGVATARICRGKATSTGASLQSLLFVFVFYCSMCLVTKVKRKWQKSFSIDWYDDRYSVAENIGFNANRDHS